MFTFTIGRCSACNRTKPLKGKKRKRCYDCYVAGYTRKSKVIPWRVEVDHEKET